MERKKIIAIVSLAIFIVAIISLSVWVKNQPTKEQKAFADKFAQDMRIAKEQTKK